MSNSTGKRPRNEEEVIDSEKASKIQSRECSLCMENEEDGQITLLVSHNCSQCKPDSWSVCEVCDQNLLSRTCPFCNHDYKPWKFYAVPNQPKVPFQFTTISDPKQKYIETLKVRILCEVLSRSNSAVYRRDQSTIYLSLPKDLSAKPADMEVLITSLPLPADRIAEDQSFLFTNATWDEIEKEIEEVKDGETEGDASDTSATIAPADPLKNSIVSAQTALKWLMQKASSDDAIILTLLSPTEWTTMLADVSADAEEDATENT